MRFSELLNTYIDKSEITKNSLISTLKIDRSTFYQILGGRRLPTEKQLNDIVDKLDIATIEVKRLMDAYERDTLGEDAYQAQLFVQSAMDIISESDYKSQDISISIKASDKKTEYKSHVSGKTQVKKILRQLIIDEMTSTTGFIDIFMYLSLQSELDIFQTLKYAGGQKDGSKVPVRQLVEFPIGNIFMNPESIKILKYYLEFLLGQNLDYKAFYYYAGGDLSARMGVIYPFYMIFSERIVLINKDGDELLLIEDENVRSAWSQGFDKLIELADSLVTSFSKKEDYVALIGSRGNKTLYIAEKRPGISFMLTKEFMDKYIPKEIHEAIYAHVNCFTHAKYVEIVSPDGIKAFREDKCINEAGFALKADEKDVEYVVEWMKERVHNTLEIVDPEKVTLSDNWSITVIDGECVILVPYLSNDKIVYITEKNIVKAFTSYMNNLSSSGLLLNEEKTEELFK